MGLSPDALFSALVDDVSVNVGRDFCEFVLQNQHLPLPPDASPQQAFAYSILKSFYKKFVDRTSESADIAALDKFTTVNHRCRDWRLCLGSARDEELVSLLKSEIENFLHPLGEPLVQSYFDILGEARTGPGASLGARGYDFYTKLFSSPLTTTSTELYDMYGDYLQWYPDWVDGEITRLFHFASPKVVTSSRCGFVPKSTTISRTICTEPSLNMFFQLGLGRIIEKRLKSYFSLDLSVQPFLNRELARIGSLEDSWVTIDLASASDSMSLRLCDELFPRWFLDILLMLRTPSTVTPNGSMPLYMVSTMGNGFTFPLQTMLFGCVVSACRRWRTSWSGSRINVFGDDIICEKDIAGDVIHLLSLLGFEVNTSKSYVEGPFRESCGCDYFLGHNVRGVYVKTLRTQQDRYAVINQLTLWSERSGVVLTSTLKLLSSTVKRYYVPMAEDDACGIKVPLSLLVPRRDRYTQSYRYECYIPIPYQIEIRGSSFRLPPGQRGRLFNPSGLYSSFLHGCVKSDSISLRHETVRYRRTWRVTPNWDYSPSVDPLAGSSFRRGCDSLFYESLIHKTQE
jgi:hypothetical protein